jgi:hypothetical protein
MTAEPLCLTCGYWVADEGGQCEMCRFDSTVGLEAAVVAAAIVWRRALIPKTSTSTAPACAGLVDAVDRLIENTSIREGL